VNQILNITAKQLWDPFPDTSYLENPGFEDRYQQYQNGDFSFIGIRVEAEHSTSRLRIPLFFGRFPHGPHSSLAEVLALALVRIKLLLNAGLLNLAELNQGGGKLHIAILTDP